MKLILSFLILHTYLTLARCECQLHVDMQAYHNIETEDSLIYFYIPIHVIGVQQNSIEILNEEGIVLDCLNMKDFKEENGILWLLPSFAMMKYINDNEYYIVYLSDESKTLTVENDAYAMIVDEYFNVKNEYFPIGFHRDFKSSIFKSDADVNMHDVVITEDKRYGILIVREFHEVTDVQDYFPDSSIKSKTLAADGFCVINTKTGKEEAALSANGLMVEFDNWKDYLLENQYSFFYQDTKLLGSDTFSVNVVHLNSLQLVKGSHFSQRYENDILMLFNSFNQEAGYLIRWDFENKSDGQSEVIWKLPGPTSLEKIKKDWLHRWEFINEPFGGFSLAHDINTYHAPEGHILVYDNGSGHRASNEPDMSCPLSRGLEYKIEMDVDGKIGYNRITLVFSYPKIENYPKYIYLENEPKYSSKDCDSFWNDYNFQPIYGSFRRSHDGYYILTDYSHRLFEFSGDFEGTTSRMLKLNSDGDIVSGWNSIDNDVISYRIVTVDSKKFRNGIYSNENYRNNSQFLV